MESLQRLDPPRSLGKYRLLARLGEGGMATVYVASVGRGALRRLAAVKLLRTEAPDHDYRTRFLDEARVVVRLHHNNIVDVREAGEVDGSLLIAMELIEGRDLADVWDRCAEAGRAFPVPLAVHLVREALRGLHYAHTFPGLALVHRDVSPSNILIDWAGAVRLADFGLATSAMRAAKTVPGMVFGKVGYMAPEQATAGVLDARADVYGCGVVLWELLTGRPLREAGTDTKQVAGWEAVPPSQRSSRVDSQLDAIVVRALQRDPNARYQSAREFMKALAGWLASHAPDTTQETMSSFLAELFGDARQRDHAAYEELLEQAKSGAFDAADLDPDTTAANPASQRAGAEILIGSVVADRYRIERELGQGGMGTVYLAEHVTVGRKVAVKVLTAELSHHPTVARRFKEEARAASAAGHQNIVEVFDAGTLPDGRLFLVMELLNGKSLYEEIEDTGQLSVVRACAIIRQVARAVRAAHGVGIIHRDLKPDNIMLVDKGEGEVVKVLDFGISASADRTEEQARLTSPGHAIGTPEYMAPEQAKGYPSTERFDIYAMGVILYEMLAGKPPFSSANILEVLTRKTTETAPPLDLQRAGLPAALVELVHLCIRTDPAERPPTVDAFLARLDPVLASLQGSRVVLTGPTALAEASSSTGRLPPPAAALDNFDAALASVTSAAVPSAGTGPLGAAASGPLPVGVHGRSTTSANLVAVGEPPASRSSLYAIIAVAAAAVMGLLVWWALPSGEAKPDAAASTANAAANVEPPRMALADAAEAGKAGADESTGEPIEPVFPSAEQEAGDGDDTQAGAASTGAQAGTEGDDAPAPTPIEDAGDGATPEPTPPTEESDSEDAATSPEPRAGGGKDPSETPKCVAVRKAAKAAYDKHDWSATLAKVGSASCWGGKYKADYREYKTRAYFETKQYGKCAKAGARGSGKTKMYADSCAKRMAMEGG